MAAPGPHDGDGAVSPPGTRDADAHAARVRVARPRVGRVRAARGRLVRWLGVLGGSVAIAVALVVAAGPVSGLRDPGSAVPPSAPETVVVRSGDTLWGIARQIAPDRDVRTVIAEIRRINQLPSAHVEPGQRLRLRAD
jgi:nucleoid-associated protein YgaU